MKLNVFAGRMKIKLSVLGKACKRRTHGLCTAVLGPLNTIVPFGLSLLKLSPSTSQTSTTPGTSEKKHKTKYVSKGFV